MFLPRVLPAVFCFCLGLRLSFSSPQPEARDKAMRDLFDYLEKRLHKQTQDEAQTDDAMDDSLEKRLHKQSQEEAELDDAMDDSLEKRLHKQSQDEAELDDAMDDSLEKRLHKQSQDEAETDDAAHDSLEKAFEPWSFQLGTVEPWTFEPFTFKPWTFETLVPFTFKPWTFPPLTFTPPPEKPVEEQEAETDDALDDSLEKRLHKQSQDEAELDYAMDDSLEKRLHKQSQDEAAVEESFEEALKKLSKLFEEYNVPEFVRPEEEVTDQDQADFGEVGEAETREALNPFQEKSFSTRTLARASKLNRAQIRVILDMHNKERTLTGGNNEMALTWDNQLARLAQGLSDTCRFGHANKLLPDGTEVGQNIAGNSDPDVSKSVQLWIHEKNDYHLKSGACKSHDACLHYTQMVWSETTKVGCGLTKCPKIGNYLVCNYLKKGNMKEKKAVNLGGKPCSKCNLYPGTACTDGLCSVCNKGTAGCRPYDPSQCIDVKKDPKVRDCVWVKKAGHCENDLYRSWMEKNCAKTCGYCRS